MLHLGEKIIIVGLFAQIAFFGFFIVVAVSFHLRFARQQRALSSRTAIWKSHMHTLYAGSVIIMIRSIFRVTEYIMGNDGFLLRHEYFLYIFDATLMFLVMLLFLWMHPSELTIAQSIEGSACNIEISSNDEFQQSRSSRRFRYLPKATE